MPCPKMRKFLIEHPDTTLDFLAGVYSASLRIAWPYDPKHVLLPEDVTQRKYMTNPVYADHIRHLENWLVGDPFRTKLPQLIPFVDEVAKTRI